MTENTWYRKGKTYRAKTMEALKQLYSAGVHATLESQPKTPWEATQQTTKIDILSTKVSGCCLMPNPETTVEDHNDSSGMMTIPESKL